MRNQLISIFIGLIAFFAVFNVFYQVAPAPVITFEDIQKHYPEGYVSQHDQPFEVISKVNQWRGYTVYEYFYCWNYDGDVIMLDCEPIILLVEDDSMKSVATRWHYNWRVSHEFPVSENGLKPIVTFFPDYHTPLFQRPQYGYIEVNKDPQPGTPPEELAYETIFGVGYLPTQSALTASITYGLLAFAFSYLFSRFIILKTLRI